MKKIILVILIIFIVIIFLILNATKTGAPVTTTTPSPMPAEANFDKNYSNLNFLKPGASTYEDVVKVNGIPKSSTVSDGIQILTYDTPNKDFENKVVLKDGRLSYAYEYVFSFYRGALSDFTKSYGTPLLLYPESLDEFDWYMFLKSGIGVEATGNIVTRVLYFIPQDKSAFLSSIGKDLRMSEVKKEYPPEPF